MSPSLAGVDAWRASDELPPNAYIARATTAERDKSSNGNEQVIVDWRVAAGDYTGAEKRDWVTLTESSMGRVVQLIEACGQEVPQEDFASYGALADWVTGMLRKGPVTEIIIRLESYTVKQGPNAGETRESSKIKGYRKPSPSDVPADASGFAVGPSVNGAVCKHEGCDEAAVVKGYCASHKIPF